MEETKWLTKGKIITFVVVILLIAGIVVGVMVHKNNLKNDYVKFEKQLEYAAPNYLLKEKIKLYEYEWREINITDILKQKLVINKRSSDCKGYVIAEALKDETLDLEESTSNVSENSKETDATDTTESNQTSTESSSEDTKKEDTTNKRVSSNITYKAYITCKNAYTTDGYGTKPDSAKKNTEETQTQKDTEKPVIELFGDKTITIKVGDTYKEPGAVATDNVDGDITKKIKITGKVDTKKEGEYVIKYTVSDKAGNKATAERKVIVEKKEEESKEDDNKNTPTDNNTNNDNNNYYRDTIAPIITFNISDAYQNICTGNSVNISVNGPYGYVARDNVDGNITSRVSITGDTGIINTPGVYNLYYTVTDSSGNRANASKQFTVRTCGNPIQKPDTTVSVTSIVVTPNAKTMTVSQTAQLSVSVFPSNATNKSVTYSSSNSNVASVTSSGLVTAKSKGTAVITVTSSNGKTGVCRITVN
ncbi:lipoprotein [Clostridium sp. CAG:433]|nr:lipoprotein [Clostridium sp. CAG:433]